MDVGRTRGLARTRAFSRCLLTRARWRGRAGNILRVPGGSCGLARSVGKAQPGGLCPSSNGVSKRGMFLGRPGRVSLFVLAAYRMQTRRFICIASREVVVLHLIFFFRSCMKYHGAAMSGDAEREEGPALRYGGRHACRGIALGLACVRGGVDAPFMWGRILRVNVGAASDRAAVPPA